MFRVAVITVSDRVHRGEYEDLSGPRIRDLLLESSLEADVCLVVVPDEKPAIQQAITDCLDRDYIFTTGGTGLSFRDVTPEVTKEICDREIPGISEFLRRESCSETRYAPLSRGFSGMKGKTIIVNFPGSVKAVSLYTRLMIPVMEHASKMILGGKH